MADSAADQHSCLFHILSRLGQMLAPLLTLCLAQAEQRLSLACLEANAR